MAHKTYIRDVEGSDKVVLFIHGFLGSTKHFEKLISAMPKDISVYNILLKGHGGSVLDFARASMVQWKNQIGEIVEILVKKHNKVYIVGHSMGTFFAMDAAVKYPDVVKGIFLLQSPLKIGVRSSAVINTLKSFFNMFNDDEVSRAYKNAHSVKLNFRIWEYIGWIPRYRELFCEAKKARSTILNVSVPCMIFQSEKDELVSMKSVDFIPEKENIRLTVLKKSAHFIYDKDELAFLEKMLCKMIESDYFLSANDLYC